MSDGLKNKMINGLAWTTVNVFGVQAIQLVIGIFLARILTIEDFGKVGILFFFVGVSTVLIDGGFGQALIRKKDATDTDISTIFFLNFIVSIALYLILFLAAPYIAKFFNQPELTLLARVLFLAVIIFSFYIIQHVKLLKKLDYKSIAIINIASVAVSSLLAIVLAINNFGVWVLIWQQLSFHLVKVILMPFFLRWKPIWVFHTPTIRESWRFSIGILGQTFLNVIFNNIYTLLIGKIDSIRNVGYYTQANKYSETVNVASNSILSSGTFPVFAQVQDDLPRLLRIYRRLVTSVTMLTFPLAAFLIAAANPLIVTIITDKWLASVILFQLLIFANIFHPVYTVNVNILNARGESKNTLRLEIFKKILIVVSILICFKLGIKAMLIGLILANFISFAASMSLIKRSMTHYYRHQVLDLVITLIIAFFCGISVYAFNFVELDPKIKLITQAASFAALYYIALRLIYPSKWNEAKEMLLEKIKKML